MEDVNYASWPLHVGRYIDVEDKKQLFLDDGFLVERTEGVRYVLHQPTRHPDNPLIVPDRPWENQVQLYGTVMWDDGVHRMWYTIRTTRYGKDSAMVVGYATSVDGLEWTKPNLGILEHEGSTENNLVLDPGPGGSGGVCVLKTPWDEDPARRYKMLYKTIEEGGGLKVAFSPDGIRWTPHPETVLAGVFDTFNVILWDDRLGKYVAYVRINQRPRKRQRSVGRTESEDLLHWTPPTIVLGPDAQDPEDSDIYTSAAFKHDAGESAYFMLPSVFDWRRGNLWIQLATSRDGVNWRRAGNRQAFIPLGAPGSFESAAVYAGVPPLVKDDQFYLYYCGTSQPHWGGMGRGQAHTSGIALATLRLDGFVSLDAGERPAGGTVTTVPIQFRGSHLEINADAHWGEIRVELLDEGGDAIEGFGRFDCEPVIGDSVRHRVNWAGGDLSRLEGTTAKLRFHLRCSRLYAFQFRA